ncbi:MAG: hypothetical protein ACJ8CR_04120 [Roseiflexaceae bacterium]
MGSSLQRLEVLMIGLIVLLAGAVVVLIMVLRPASPSAYLHTTPQPIAGGTAGWPTRAPVQTLAAPPTAISAATSVPQTTIAPAAMNAPAATALPGSIIGTAPGIVRPSLAVPPIVRAMWPWLVLLASLIGGIQVGLRIRRQRRMTYTNQSVGQLLATADATTRDTNLKVMQNLAAQGLLTAELAAVAGIDLAQLHQQRAGRLPTRPVLRLQIAWPDRAFLRLTLLKRAALRFPKPYLSRRRQRPLTIDLAPTTPLVASANSNGTCHAAPLEARQEMSPGALVADAPPAVPAPVRGLDIVLPDGAPGCGPPEAALSALPAALDAVLAAAGEDADPWTSEERARAVATLIAELWAEEALHSPILALDTVSTPGGGQVRVTIDQHPDEAGRIIDVPERIVALRPTWRAAWRRDALEVIVATDHTPPVGGPLIVPVLTHGRGGKTMRWYPLTFWRHLGFYGSDAVGALHAALGSLLYAQPPAHVALAILDHGEIAPLYRNVAHLVPLPDSPRETIERLAQAVKHSARGYTRPLVLVVVEPDDTILNRLCGIVARLQARPTIPVHVLIAQERVRSAGRDLYALLPALIVSGGRGNTAVLPGQGDWPKRGEARLVGRGMRAEGRAITWDEAAIAAAVAELRGQPTDLPPVLWDAPLELTVLPTAVGVLGEEPLAADMDGIVVPEERIADAQPVADAEPIKDAAPNGQEVPIHDNDARGTDVRPTDAEPAASSAATPALKPDAPTLAHAVDASTPAVVGDGAAPIASPEAAPDPGTLAAVDPASDDDTNHPALSTDAPAVAADTPASRLAALLRASRDAGSAATVPLHMLRLHPGDLYTGEPSIVASALAAAAEPPPMVEPDNGWPIGPAPLGRVAMAELLARMVATPAITAGQANELGVTKNRVVDLLKSAHKAQAKELAEILLVWFDLANLLVEPTKPGRLRHPRALTTLNLAEIAARLDATPCPDKGTVQAMWAESNEGRN